MSYFVNTLPRAFIGRLSAEKKRDPLYFSTDTPAKETHAQACF
jgi:hypothetical protein